MNWDAAAAAWPLESWPKTPAACDGEGGTFDVMKSIRENLNPKAKLRDWTLMAGFPTALVNDTLGSTHCYGKKVEGEDRKIFLKLPGAAQLAGFPTTTTTTRDSKSEGKDGPNRTGAPSLPAVALKANCLLGVDPGRILGLFFVPTGRRVVLAPEFSLWLMGFPEAWVTAAPGAKDWREAQAALELECSKDRETPSSPGSALSSSAPSDPSSRTSK